MAQKSRTQLLDLGLEAADHYVDDHGSLNEAITKIAMRENLNTNEIQRVAEFANQGTYAELQKRAGQKTIEFDRADASQITTGLNEKAAASRAMPDRGFHKRAELGMHEKVGSAAGAGKAVGRAALLGLAGYGTYKALKGTVGKGKHSKEYMEEQKRLALEKWQEMQGTKEGQEILKEANQRLGHFKEAGTPQQRREHGLEAMKVYRDRIREGVYDRQQTKLAAQTSVATWIQEQMNEQAGAFGGPETKRGAEAAIKTASFILNAVAAHDVDFIKQAAFLTDLAVKSLNPSIELDVTALAQLEKTAGPVEGHRIAPFLSTPDTPVQIVNGNHRIFLDLEVIQKCDTDLAALRYNLVKADDEVAYTAKVVRENMGLPAQPVATGARPPHPFSTPSPHAHGVSKSRPH